MICIHGQLKGDCYICDLESENAELRAENKQLRKQLKGNCKQVRIDKETVQYLDEQWLDKARKDVK